MDTIVRDPFYEHMPEFFEMTFDEFLDAKHPTSWVSFERGDIEEQELYDNFWKPGGSRYTLLPGMDPLLRRLAAAGYALHACSNYPVWWQEVEARLGLSDLLSWTFLSCQGPMAGLRKPEPSAFRAAANHLGVDTRELLLVDDRAANVEAARGAGLQALHFSGAEQLERDLLATGLSF